MKDKISKIIDSIKKIFRRKKSPKKNGDSKKTTIIKISAIGGGVVVLGVLVYLFIRNPSFLIVAKVNGDYITRAELNRAMAKSFGMQTLEDLAYKKLAQQEFEKNNIVIDPLEIDARIVEIEQSLGGMSLESALGSSGMTLDELRENISLQMSLEKLLEDKVVVTQEQIDAFLTQNEDQLEGLSEEDKNTYAQDQVRQQNLQVEMSKWFDEMRENAEIKYFL